ncbi:hypothetical protein BDW68DRAFT_149972 [Aspergillus falconensis]
MYHPYQGCKLGSVLWHDPQGTSGMRLTCFPRNPAPASLRTSTLAGLQPPPGRFETTICCIYRRTDASKTS